VAGSAPRFPKTGSAEDAVLARPDGVVAIKKTDAELQVVWGEVYAPGYPDSQGDFMQPASIREMAWGFMKKQALHKIDVQHSQQESGSYIVESFIAREGDPLFIPGAWVVGVKIPELAIWALVKSGELNGFSLDGFGLRTETTLEIELPDSLDGETDDVAGHRHAFTVRFGAGGAFLGGETGPGPDGHVHKIARGTLTEPAGSVPHSHRFSFVEGVLRAQAAA
jgi:hypothetical protein